MLGLLLFILGAVRYDSGVVCLFADPLCDIVRGSPKMSTLFAAVVKVQEYLSAMIIMYKNLVFYRILRKFKATPRLKPIQKNTSFHPLIEVIDTPPPLPPSANKAVGQINHCHDAFFYLLRQKKTRNE